MNPPPRKVSLAELSRFDMCIESEKKSVYFMASKLVLSKVKPAVALKNIQSEQTTKLQAKHQQECDILEDIR